MTRRPQTSEYIPLASNGDEEEDLRSPVTKSYQFSGKDSSNPYLTTLACIAAIVSCILSIVLFAIGDESTFSVLRAMKASAGTALPRPNPYVNLVVLPTRVGDRSRRMWEDDRDHWTPSGMVHPDDRHIVVTPQNTSVLQFLYRDFAIERCVLTASVPCQTARFDPAVTLIEPSRIDVWVLDAPTELSRYIESTTDTAPRRNRLLATLAVASERPSTTGELACRSNEFLTLELACSPSTPACHVYFWQDKRIEPPAGIFLTQHAGFAGGAHNRR